MSDVNVDDFLGQLEEEWENASGEADFTVDIPDGSYPFEITKAYCNVSQGGRPQAVFELVCLDPKHPVKARKYDGLDNAQAMGYFKKGLRALGVDIPSSTRNISGTVSEMAGLAVVIKIRTTEKGDKTYQNFYFERLHQPL